MNKGVRNRNRTGSVMVEFALVLPIMVGLFLGVVIFGYDFHIYQRLEESVRTGARFASMQKYDGRTSKDKPVGPDPSIPPCTAPPCRTEITSGDFLNDVRKVTSYGCDPDTEAASGCTATPITEGVLPANVRVFLTTNGIDPVTGQVRRSVTVSVRGVTLWTPTGTMTLNDKPVTTFTHVGNFIPR
jgi:Flp pilus assembly protein TadG